MNKLETARLASRRGLWADPDPEPSRVEVPKRDLGVCLHRGVVLGVWG